MTKLTSDTGVSDGFRDDYKIQGKAVRKETPSIGLPSIPMTPGLFACKEIKMFEGCTLYFSASFLTTGLVKRGESFEPRGEYAVTTIPLDLQKSTISSWVQQLYVQMMRSTIEQSR